MRSNYEEKKANRLERYERLVAKYKAESNSRYERAKSLLSVIPMGQPILVGHHSESGHRSLLKKSDNNMRKSVEADKKADYYEGRAESIESNNAISSDDPNATERLAEKVKRLQANQDLMKRVNKFYPQYKKNPALLDEQDFSEVIKKFIREWVPMYSFEKVPFPRYSLSNNNANISTAKKRLEKLLVMEKSEDKESTIGEIRIFENASENRVQIFFPGKPSNEVRSELKRSGFRWSPTSGAWQAFYSNRAKWNAERIVKSTSK